MPLTDDALLGEVRAALLGLIEPRDAERASGVARNLLTLREVSADVHVEGIRALLHQLVRNRDPEMQSNHLTELRIAHALSRVGDRRIELERRCNDRNERRVDFAIDDAHGTVMVEVKNLNLPLIKRSADPLTETLRDALRGTTDRTDLHLFYLFFRRPQAEDQAFLAHEVRQAWVRTEQDGRGMRVFFSPDGRPRVGAIIAPARQGCGGRVMIYDHGQHLRAQAGARLRIAHHARASQRRPRERLEEMFIKDNVLRRLQDAEQKFPLDGPSQRAVLLCPGPWAPSIHVDRCVREAVHWYVEGTATHDDLWAPYYPHWARRWAFRPLRNIDGIYLVRPLECTASDSAVIAGGDVTLEVRTVFERTRELGGRIFFGE